MKNTLQILILLSLLHRYILQFTKEDWVQLKNSAYFNKYERIQHWSVFQWTNSSFWSKLIGDRLDNVYISDDSNVFPYYDTVVSKRFRNFSPEFRFENFSKNEALEAIQSDKTRFYYSGNILSSSFDRLREDINVSSLVDDALRDQLMVLVWLGSRGVEASPHYDAVNNIYIQLHGIKQFRLVAPKYIELLSFHGRFHPYACQSRRTRLSGNEEFDRNFFVIENDILSSSFNTSNMKSQICESHTLDVIDLTLHPGDVVYIPAFWFHEVFQS